MNYIVVNYDPFSVFSNISVYEDGKMMVYQVLSEMFKLGQSIAELAHQYEIYHVRIDAPKVMLDEIRACVQGSEQATYSANKITIEGI